MCFEYIQNHKQEMIVVYERVQQDLQSIKEKLIAKISTKGEFNSQFQLNPMVFKKRPNERNKNHNKFISPFTFTYLLDHNKVEMKEQKREI